MPAPEDRTPVRARRGKVVHLAEGPDGEAACGKRAPKTGWVVATTAPTCHTCIEVQ